MAGVLAHSRELTVFTNPLPNSYQRFGCDEAHRRIEKLAMDTRRDRTEIAQEILDSYEDVGV